MGRAGNGHAQTHTHIHTQKKKHKEKERERERERERECTMVRIYGQHMSRGGKGGGKKSNRVTV